MYSIQLNIRVNFLGLTNPDVNLNRMHQLYHVVDMHKKHLTDMLLMNTTMYVFMEK